MAKIIYVSDYVGLSTGYGVVGKNLTGAFSQAGHDIIHVGWGYNGEPHNFPFKIIPCNTHQDNFGEDILARLIRDEQPDIVFSLSDPWMVQWFPHMEERKAVCWVAYFPLDGFPVPPDWHEWMKNIDVPVVMSKFGFQLAKEILGKDPVYIPHGVNTSVFKPLDNINAIKRQIIGRDDVFVVGCVARNQPRKNIPALIKAFSQFAKNKDDVALYLHMQIRDVGWNIDELIGRFGLNDKAYATNGFTALNGIPDEELNKLYNMFDVMALPSMSEGFGLPLLESQSAGTPVLVTDFSACTELTVDKQELIRVKDTLIMGRNIEQAIADTDDLAHKLNIFYRDWKNKDSKKLKELGSKGRQKALGMDWNRINQEFIKVIEKVEPEAKKLDKTIRPRFYQI
ncbi:MAG TPA: glycosyltransferase family 4 protein [Geobacterales bacterium]|nr:glycosyltransferase family 4 protein [Geobacterales bacterium]